MAAAGLLLLLATPFIRYYLRPLLLLQCVLTTVAECECDVDTHVVAIRCRGYREFNSKASKRQYEYAKYRILQTLLPSDATSKYLSLESKICDPLERGNQRHGWRRRIKKKKITRTHSQCDNNNGKCRMCVNPANVTKNREKMNTKRLKECIIFESMQSFAFLFIQRRGIMWQWEGEGEGEEGAAASDCLEKLVHTRSEHSMVTIDSAERESNQAAE